jgi:cation diffusion facilitator family transporter
MTSANQQTRPVVIDTEPEAAADSCRSDASAAREKRGRDTRRVSLVTGIVNLLLSIVQILVGLLANSAALIADGVHSASDLVSDIIVWFAARHAAQEPDRDHPYGHGRFETAATLALGILLIAVAAGIVWSGIERMLGGTLTVPGEMALVVAAIGIVAKESLYWYTIAVARRIKSDLLRANAWHHRSDAISSIVVLIGVGGSLMGFAYMDTLAAVVVGLMVAKIGWDLGRNALLELVDTALDDDAVEQTRQLILGIDGVRGVHMLRTRRVGAEASVDVHVQVAPRLTVSEGHMISQAVEDTLVAADDDITDVTVHIDPEDDDDAPTCRGLPSRAEIRTVLDAALQAAGLPALQPHQVRLHYLGGKVDIELVLPLEDSVVPDDADSQRRELTAALANHPWFGRLQLLYA